MPEGNDERGMLGAPADDPLGQRELFEALRVRLFGRKPEIERIGRYELRERIGGGGGGIVYRAWDTALRRPVALKLIRDMAAPDGEQLTRRLKREARALAQAEHPNVLPIYDVGEDTGRIYVAMELVDGTDLRGWLAAEPRTPSEILGVFGEAGEGLVAAHAAGVVHRDFKPANVMLGHDGRVRVMDFGIARLERRGHSTVPDEDSAGIRPHRGPREVTGGITHTGAIVGTPAYMAPEQWDGAVVGPAADQFSFCAALFEALTGRLPEAGPGDGGVGLNRRVARIIERGLDRHPSERWPTMHALLRALEGAGIRRRWSRWTWGAAAATATVSAVVVAAQTTTSSRACESSDTDALWNAVQQDIVAASFSETGLPFARQTWERVDARVEEYRVGWTRQRELACREPDDDERRRRVRCLDDAMRNARSTVALFENADGATVRHAVRAIAALPPPRRCAEPQPTPAPDLQPWFAQLDEAKALAHLGHYEESISLLERIVANTSRDDAATLHARALHRWGVNLYILSRAEEAAQRLEESAWIADGAGDHQTAAESMTTLILVVGDGLARGDEARRWDRHARAAIERVGNAPELEAERLDNLGVLAYEAGEYDHARELREKALALVEDIVPKDDPAVANYLNGIGNSYFSQERLEDAERYYRRVIAIRESAYGTEHPMVASSLNNLGNVRWAMGDDDGALAIYERSLRMKEEAFGERNEGVATALTNLANIHLKRGDKDQARALYERALAIWETIVGDRHPNIAVTLSNLGAVELEAGRGDVARRHLERALAILESTVGAEDPNVPSVLTNLAMALSGTGHRDRATRMHERALRQHRRIYGPVHPAVAMSITNLALEAFARDDFEEAARLYAEGAEIRRRCQGEDHPDQALPLTGLGRALVHGDRPAEAIGPLRRALALLGGKEVAPLKRGQPRYALARALWRTGGDRSEALSLAREALEAFESGDETLEEDATIVRTWLKNPH